MSVALKFAAVGFCKARPAGSYHSSSPAMKMTILKASLLKVFIYNIQERIINSQESIALIMKKTALWHRSCRRRKKKGQLKKSNIKRIKQENSYNNSLGFLVKTNFDNNWYIW